MRSTFQRDVRRVGPHWLPVQPELAVKSIVRQEDERFAGGLRLELDFSLQGLIAARLADEAGHEGFRVFPSQQQRLGDPRESNEDSCGAVFALFPRHDSDRIEVDVRVAGRDERAEPDHRQRPHHAEGAGHVVADHLSSRFVDLEVDRERPGG